MSLRSSLLDDTPPRTRAQDLENARWRVEALRSRCESVAAHLAELDAAAISLVGDEADDFAAFRMKVLATTPTHYRLQCFGRTRHVPWAPLDAGEIVVHARRYRFAFGRAIRR